MMRTKGITLIELIIVIVIMSVIAAVFVGLVSEMVEGGFFIMGKKEAYQKARVALQTVTDDIRYNIRGGDEHNFGVSTGGVWQFVLANYCTDQQFSYKASRIATPVAFIWGTSVTGQPLFPSGKRYLLWYPAQINPRVLFGVNTGEASFAFKYFDDRTAPPNEIPAAGGLTQTNAKSVTRVEVTLTVTQKGQPVSLSESIFVRQKGLPPTEAGAH